MNLPIIMGAVKSGNPPHIVPDDADETYQRRCTKKYAHFDWFKPVGQVYNLIGGTNPAPGAWTTHNGEELSDYDSTRLAGDGVAVRVMEITEMGVTVQSVGGRIMMKRVKLADGEKQPAAEWAAANNISVGDNLGTQE